jgi:hypothetical protein
MDPVPKLFSEHIINHSLSFDARDSLERRSRHCDSKMALATRILTRVAGMKVALVDDREGRRRKSLLQLGADRVSHAHSLCPRRLPFMSEISTNLHNGKPETLLAAK